MAIEKEAAYSVYQMKCVARNNSWKEQLSGGGGGSRAVQNRSRGRYLFS